MRYDTVFWDFNGTVVDDVALGMRSVNRMLKKRGLPCLADTAAYHAVFCFPIREYYCRLGFDFERESYEKLAVEWVENYVSEESTLSLSSGFLRISDTLHSAGIRQIILSSSETEMLHRQLKILNVENRFDAIYGIDNIYAGGKIEMAKRCIGSTADRAVLIGDTTHDADTARAIGSDCILYAGGHGERSALSACGFPVVDHLTDLLPLL